ncbi:MAG: amino acid ABC transporter permease [Candidatus Thermoplasmatota archaeon]|nr:amino acid ABC transporter permease [Candidatus Thermoplasmatota archaeon]
MISEKESSDNFAARALYWHHKFDEEVSGKPARWVNEDNRNQFSVAILLASLIIAVNAYLSEMDKMYLDVSEWRNILHCLITASMSFFAWSTTLSIALKGTFMRSRSTALLGLVVAWATYILVSAASYFTIIGAEWDVIFANRSTLFLGIHMNTGVVNSDYTNETWRLWPSLILSVSIISAAFGTTQQTTRDFLVKLGMVWAISMFYVWYPTYLYFNPDNVMLRLTLTAALGASVFLATRRYTLRSEEYLVNRLRSYIALASVITFFIAIILLDPPKSIVDNGWMEVGIAPFLWGGFFVNLILIAATLVLGFGMSVLLAFGRRSEILFFSLPATMIIELVRSGPMVAWLFIALFILPDVISPIFDADVVVRTIMAFSIFGACYIAEVLRGGLQNVPRGQVEAATALGLSPTQIKLFVELPSAIRTTLPAIVSIFIGLWKDTTLVYLLGVLDLFAISKVLPATDINFGDDYLEPLIFSALLFWVVALALSRISLKVEQSLGLGVEGGGEAT